MNPIRKFFSILLKIIAAILALALVLLIVVVIQYYHRSDPADIITYETTNPHIKEITQVSAHRSGGGIMPEETLMAFKNCAENPDFSVDVFEFDLRLTKDDVLVLLHDPEMDRTSDSELVFGAAGVQVGDKTYEELRQLNMGAKFTDEKGEMPFADLHGADVPDDLRIVSLDEIFDYLEGLGSYDYIIEIKDGGDRGKKAVDILYSILKERDLLDNTSFGSFHGEVSQYKDEAYPDLTRGAFAGEVIDFFLAAVTNKKDYVPPCDVLQLPFNLPEETYGLNLGTAQVINFAHAHNMAVQYWTVNDEKNMTYLVSVGADCIMSDYPDKLYHVRESLLNPAE